MGCLSSKEDSVQGNRSSAAKLPEPEITGLQELSSAVDQGGLLKKSVSRSLRSMRQQTSTSLGGLSAQHTSLSSRASLAPSEARSQGSALQPQQVPQELALGPAAQNATDIVWHEKIGQGGFGSIYKADLDGKVVAVKVINIKEMVVDNVLIHQEKKERLADMESFLNTQMDHKHVIKTHRIDLYVAERGKRNSIPDDGNGDGWRESDDEGTALYDDLFQAPSAKEKQRRRTARPKERVRLEWLIVMDYCPLGSLQTGLDRHVFHKGYNSSHMLLDMWAVLQTLIEVVDALEYLHSRKVMHGDLKAANVLLSSDTQDRRCFCVKLTDFGLSRVLSGTQTHICTATYGTVTHMPPELLSSGLLTYAADMFALGVLMWEMYTAERPFPTLTDSQVIVNVVKQGLRPSFPSDAPAAYQQLAAACWTEDKNDRPKIEEVAAALQQMQADMCPLGQSEPAICVRRYRKRTRRSASKSAASKRRPDKPATAGSGSAVRTANPPQTLLPQPARTHAAALQPVPTHAAALQPVPTQVAVHDEPAPTHDAAHDEPACA